MKINNALLQKLIDNDNYKSNLLIFHLLKTREVINGNYQHEKDSGVKYINIKWR